MRASNTGGGLVDLGTAVDVEAIPEACFMGGGSRRRPRQRPQAPWEARESRADDLLLKDYLLERWLPARRHTWAEGTIRYRYWAVESVLVPDLGHLRLSEITTEGLEAWMAWRLTEPFATSGRVPKPGTMRGLLTTLSAALNQAMRWQLIDDNPVVGIPLPRSTVDALRIWTPEHVQRFLIAVAGSRYEPLWRLLFATGLRRGEALGLRWSDIDLDNAYLRVQQCLLAGSRAGALLYGPPKSQRSRRTVTLDDGTVEVLRRLKERSTQEWLARREALEQMIALHRQDGVKAPVLSPTLSQEQPVFVQPDGTPLLPATASDAFRREVAAAGLPKIRLHDTRHSHLTHLLRSGEPIQNVAARAGHGSAFTTLSTYAHVVAGDDRRTAARAAGIFGETPQGVA